MKEIFTKNEIYTNINNRLTNPFIFSFSLSWLFWNWPIVIGLLWYSSSNIKDLDVSSYLELINKNANGWRNYGLPLICALAYTILIPILKWFIDWFNAVFARKSQDSVLKATQTGFIPTLKFIELKKSYEGYINELSEIIQKEGSMQKEVNDLSSSLLANEQQLKVENDKVLSLTAKINKLSIMSSINILEGEWKVKVKFSKNTSLTEKVWLIRDNLIENISIHRSSRDNFLISFYVCDPISGTASIELRTNFNDNSLQEVFQFSNLKWSNEFSFLRTLNKEHAPINHLELIKVKK